jgi:hypothetical protein
MGLPPRQRQKIIVEAITEADILLDDVRCRGRDARERRNRSASTPACTSMHTRKPTSLSVCWPERCWDPDGVGGSRRMTRSWPSWQKSSVTYASAAIPTNPLPPSRHACTIRNTSACLWARAPFSVSPTRTRCGALLTRLSRDRVSQIEAMDPNDYEKQMQKLRDERVAEAMKKLREANVRKVRQPQWAERERQRERRTAFAPSDTRSSVALSFPI